MTLNRMYITLAPVILPNCLQVTKVYQEQLWHCRYGHLSYKGLKVLMKKDMVKGLPVLQESNEICSDCVEGKHYRDSIPKAAA
jgi:hypothetical protein